VPARVLGAALGIPVHGLCTLDVIAADVDAGGEDFLVATDARRRELYWAHYDGTGRRVAGPEVSKPALIPVSGLRAAGEGPMLYPEVLPDGLGPAFPAAGTLCKITMAALAAGDPDHLLLPPEPLYLRRPDAREPGAPKRVTSYLPGERPTVPPDVRADGDS
jgi:tRNA threonylcarbamoyl adenosine modification protein YeaZ